MEFKSTLMKRHRKNNTLKSNNHPIGSNIWKYARLLEEKRGHNYQYYSEKLEKELEEKGYSWHKFEDGNYYTDSEYAAKILVNEYRKLGNYSRIICGMFQNVQRIKTFSICYKRKSI